MLFTSKPGAADWNSSKAVTAASIGTLLEWYDLFVFASLASVIAGQFFPGGHPATALLYTLAIFGAGLIMRPLGAVIFGRMGDRIGRKPVFLLTLVLMGSSSFAIGLVPGYPNIGMAAPLLILLLRLLQGLALGGEYAAATAYTAEYAPAGRRGFTTSWIQLMTTGAFFLSLGVILLTRHVLDPDPARSIDKFNEWGWRVPFLVSLLPVGLAVYLRLKIKESPLFDRLKKEGKLSANPLKESLGQMTNLKWILLALFGAAMGQGVIFYTSHLYAQSFLEDVCKIGGDQSKTLLLLTTGLSLPFFVVFGGWSDRVGRKWIMLAGMLLAIITWRPLFHELQVLSDTAGRTELTAQKEIRTSVAFIGKSRDLVRTSATLSHYEGGFSVTVTTKDTVYANGATSAQPIVSTEKTVDTTDYWKMAALLFIMLFCVAMAGGPMAAFLVELFPARIRTTSVSLSYQLGYGIFGGLVPLIAVGLTTHYPIEPLAGLWYPIGVGALCLLIGAIYLPSGAKEETPSPDNIG